jgi:hypothetical protein
MREGRLELKIIDQPGFLQQVAEFFSLRHTAPLAPDTPADAGWRDYIPLGRSMSNGLVISNREHPARLVIEAPCSKLQGMRSLLDLSSLLQTAWSFDPQG